ncbi:MAG: hypothetical protein LBU64_08355 [Planctomycetota bacterium]|nr:hypothetical protein [Planctomycetota bacterium]
MKLANPMAVLVVLGWLAVAVDAEDLLPLRGDSGKGEPGVNYFQADWRPESLAGEADGVSRAEPIYFKWRNHQADSAGPGKTFALVAPYLGHSRGGTHSAWLDDLVDAFSRPAAYSRKEPNRAGE